MNIVRERVAKLARLAEQQLPEAWIPATIGDTIVGLFVRLEQGSTVRGPAWIAILKTEDGKERSVWLLHTVLRNALARLQPETHELVLIKYEGTKESNAGQKYEAYRVLVDREQPVPEWELLAESTRLPDQDVASGSAEGGAPF
jgi:hypothetical protein